MLYSLHKNFHFTSVHFTSVHFTSLHFTSLHFTALHFTSLHLYSLLFTYLHCSSLHCTSLQFPLFPCKIFHHQIKFSLLINTFLTLFLKLCSLQGKVASTSSSSCFQSFMVLFTNEYSPVSVLIWYHRVCKICVFVCVCVFLNFVLKEETAAHQQLPPSPLGGPMIPNRHLPPKRI
jgi:hypothetical protein